MRQTVFGSAILALAVLSAGVVSPVGGVDSLEVRRPSTDEALATDLELVAKAKGWTLDDAAAHHRMAAVLGRIAEQVATHRPDSFVGSALPEDPRGVATLYVKGPADEFIVDLVGASGIAIDIADHQPFSFDELELRKLRVHHALEARGYRYVSSSVNISGGGLIPSAVTIEPGLPTTADEILTSLPPELRASVRLTISDKPVVTDYTSFGGMWVRSNAGNQCTSGWSVKHANGATGITTAGHCTNAINQINHPGQGLHALTFQAEHRGQWGDIEWYQSNVAEVDDFYAQANEIRDVTNVEARANIAVGEFVCQYGRASDDRDCSLAVQDVSQACTNSGVFNDRLVMMNGITAIKGDSGGGWSFGGFAYGSSKGGCLPDFLNNDTWSVADLYDEALGVSVIVLPNP